MNAIEFIETRTVEYLVSTTADQAYDEFISQGSIKAGKGFFKVKWGNTCRKNDVEVLLVPVTKVNDIADLAVKHYTENPTHAVVPKEKSEKLVIVNKKEVKEDVEDEGLPKRVIVDYNDPNTELNVPSMMPTGTVFDRFISDRITSKEDLEEYKEKFGEEMPIEDRRLGGFTRQCVDIVAGKAGTGKTYSRCILAVKAKIFAKQELDLDLNVGFISGEMRKSEWDKEVEGSSMLRNLKVDFMLDYVGHSNYEEIFWEAFGYYDIGIVDSLPAIISHFNMSRKSGDKRTEKAMIFDFILKSLKIVGEKNNNIQLINQATKDGNYKGGTELPHMMSSMSFVVKDKEGRRYMTFEKNRNNGGQCNRSLYFNKLKSGDIEFNEDTYAATYETTEDKSVTVEELINSLQDDSTILDNAGMDTSNGTEITVEESKEEDVLEPSNKEEPVKDTLLAPIRRWNDPVDTNNKEITVEPGETMTLDILIANAEQND
mgnify:CR=1 FL=1